MKKYHLRKVFDQSKNSELRQKIDILQKGLTNDLMEPKFYKRINQKIEQIKFQLLTIDNPVWQLVDIKPDGTVDLIFDFATGLLKGELIHNVRDLTGTKFYEISFMDWSGNEVYSIVDCYGTMIIDQIIGYELTELNQIIFWANGYADDGYGMNRYVGVIDESRNYIITPIKGGEIVYNAENKTYLVNNDLNYDLNGKIVYCWNGGLA